MSSRIVRAAWVITCDGFPAGKCASKATFSGATGEPLKDVEREAKMDGWLIKFGEICPDCVQKATER